MRDFTENLMQKLSARFGGYAMAIDDAALMQHASRAASFGFTVSAPAGVNVEKRDGVAIIYVDGVMVPQAEWPDEVSTEQLSEAFDLARQDDSIHSAVMLINSPGGMVLGQERLLTAATAFAKEKTLVAHAEGLCCSAGYWLATVASRIYATPGSMIGSIGVRSHMLDFTKMFENLGVKSIAIDTGPLKSMGVMGEPVSDEQIAHAQASVDFIFAAFGGAVAESRNISGGKLGEVTTGGSWYVEQTLAASLHDGIQQLTKTLAGINDGTFPEASSTKKEAVVAEKNETNEPQVASTAELKKTFPNSSAEWREEQTEADATMAEAAVAYAQFQEQEAEKARTERDEANERAEKAEKAEPKTPEKTKSKRGVASAKQNPGEDEESQGEVDYAAMASDLSKKDNILYREAAQIVMRSHPDAHAAFSQSNARAKYRKHFSKT